MAALSREDAIVYLANNPNFQPSKPLEAYSTAQLRRYAQVYFLAEQAGKTITQKRARGHAAAPITHYPAKYFNPRSLEMHEMSLLEGEDYMSLGDLKNLLKKGKKTEPRLFIVTGVVTYNGITALQTISFYVYEADLTAWLKVNPNNLIDITEFCTAFSGNTFESVEQIALAYPVNPQPKI